MVLFKNKKRQTIYLVSRVVLFFVTNGHCGVRYPLIFTERTFQSGMTGKFNDMPGTLYIYRVWCATLLHLRMAIIKRVKHQQGTHICSLFRNKRFALNKMFQ